MARTAFFLRYVWVLPTLLWAEFAPAALDFHPVFKALDVPSGLPDPHVEAIVQDIHGYVWIGTRGGLLRHEGRELNMLPRDPQHPASLPDNNIMSLHAHSDGMVWAGVAGAGAVEIGPDLLSRRHLAPISSGGELPHGHIWSMAEDCEGHLWLAFMQGGVARFDPVSEQLLIVPQEEEYGLNPEGFQMQIAVDADCRVWLAQSHRLSVMDSVRERPHFVKLLAGDAENQIVFFSLLDHSELGMLAARGRELLLWSRSDAEAAASAVQVLATFDGVVGGMAELPDRRVVVSTTEGLGFFDPRTGGIEQIKARPDLPEGLSNNILAGATLVDHEGGLWVAVLRSGLVYLPPEHAVFARLHRGFRTDSDTILERVSVVSAGLDSRYFWTGAEGGIQRIDESSGVVEHSGDLFPDYPAELRKQTLRGLWERPNGLLVLELGSLWWLRPQPEQNEVLLNVSELAFTNFVFLHPHGPDSLWMGTSTLGVVHYDLLSRELRRYGPDQPPPFTLPEPAPQLMSRDPGDQLILAGTNTLYRYRQDQGFYPVARVERDRISDLAFASDGSLWIAKDAGLSQWRWGNDAAQHLRDHDIRILVERASLRRVFPLREDEVWLVLSSGVARLNPQTGEVRLFTRSDGLPPDEFHPRATKTLPDGRIVVGGNRGLVFVKPDRVRGEPIKPPVHLTRITAGDFDQVLVPGPRRSLALDWRQNSVRFEFSALTFIAPERLNYRVRLHGWDDDWIELRALGQMYYSNLRSGSYRFEVQAATDAGHWNELGDSVVIDLAAPPWASRPAFAAYAGFLLIGIAASWRGVRQARRRRLHLHEIQQKRALAEGQRKLLERLNEDLEPIPLARAIVAEMLRLTAARRASFGYVHEQMPRQVVTAGESDRPSREAWLAEMQMADGQRAQLVDLKADRELIARVLLQAADGGFKPDHEQHLALLVDLAEQSLHNSLLLQRVKRLAERAEAANQAKSEFLATMSHEIRTPLHGVLGMADLIHEAETDPSRIDLIDTLRSSGRQLQRIIDDVLDISRIEAGRLSLKREPFELVSLLEHVIDLHAPNAARKQLDLRLRIQSDLPVLGWGDPDRLAQILGNLISNAVKFTDHGAVELAAGLDPQHKLVFAVMDSGPGIAESDRSRLFQPFTQLDASISRTHGGSGLGLAICRRLADSMGGCLQLETQRWPGSKFRLSLPNAAPPMRMPPTAMLADVTVVALLDAPSYRIVHRLARRWGFRLRNGWSLRPEPGALLLLRASALHENPHARAWLALSSEGLCLQSPYPGSSERELPRQQKLRFLRWPLQEGRLIAALMDCVLERQS